MDDIGKGDCCITMDTGSPNLYLIMKDDKFEYCLFRIVCEPKNSVDESTIYNFGDPLFKLTRSAYPDGMSFVSVGTRIFMVGGYYGCEDDRPYRVSNETFIYDTSSADFHNGPPLVSGKAQPLLLVIGTKIYALSRIIDSSYPNNSAMDPKPRFEVLDTDHLDEGWCALSIPKLYVSQSKEVFNVESYAVAYDGVSVSIIISVEEGGTYLFDVDNKVWKYVGNGMLPFIDHAISMPPLPDLPFASSLCCAYSSTSDNLSAFGFRCYENEGEEKSHILKVDVVGIDMSPLDVCPPLPPELYFEWPVMCFDSTGLVYFITGGIDNSDANNTGEGNRYVKVEVCQVRHNKSQLLKSCKEKKSQKSHMGHDHKEEESVTLGLEKGISPKKCSNKRLDRDDEKGDETLEFKLTPIWRRSFSGGPMCETSESVYAAFAI